MAGSRISSIFSPPGSVKPKYSPISPISKARISAPVWLLQRLRLAIRFLSLPIGDARHHGGAAAAPAHGRGVVEIGPRARRSAVGEDVRIFLTSIMPVSQ